MERLLMTASPQKSMKAAIVCMATTPLSRQLFQLAAGVDKMIEAPAWAGRRRQPLSKA